MYDPCAQRHSSSREEILSDNRVMEWLEAMADQLLPAFSTSRHSIFVCKEVILSPRLWKGYTTLEKYRKTRLDYVPQHEAEQMFEILATPVCWSWFNICVVSSSNWQNTQNTRCPISLFKDSSNSHPSIKRAAMQRLNSAASSSTTLQTTSYTINGMECHCCYWLLGDGQHQLRVVVTMSIEKCQLELFFMATSTSSTA